MSTNTATSNRSQAIPTLPSLPPEVWDQILYYLYVHSFPIYFDHPNGFKTEHEHVSRGTQILDVLSEGREIFYRHNVFHVDDIEIQQFLNYTPTTGAEGNNTNFAMPVDHVKHVVISMQPLIRPVRYDSTPDLRSLLKCSNLVKVELRLAAFYEGLCEWDQTFKRIASACVELGDKLGADGLTADVSYLYGKRCWTMADFRSGKPPTGYP